MKKILNSKYQKIAADWFRNNIPKPSEQALDIQTDDFFLIHKEDGRTVWRAVVYGELYNIVFTQVHSMQRGTHARLYVTKVTTMCDEIIQVSAR